MAIAGGLGREKKGRTVHTNKSQTTKFTPKKSGWTVGCGFVLLTLIVTNFDYSQIQSSVFVCFGVCDCVCLWCLRVLFFVFVLLCVFVFCLCVCYFSFLKQ